jgi:branched-chain amino acid transport system permease protein
MAGGILLGLVESLAVTVFSATYKDVTAFVVLILILLLRPRGLFGEATPEKV